MKKITLLLIMILLLAACGGTEEAVSPTEAAVVEEETAVSETPTEEAAEEALEEEATAEVVEETEAAAETDEASSETFATSSVSTLANCDTSNVLSQSTDADVEQLRTTVVAFRASLSEELLEAGSTCLSDERVYLWHNTPANDNNRNGITYGDLTDEQIALFQVVLEAFLSDDGYQKVEEITFMSEGYLNTVRAELWSTDYYSIDMFGDPENTGSWGVQLDGHHAAINFFVHGDDVSIVPAFLGAEPMTGSLDGEAFDIFSAERDLAFALYATLTDDELAAAVSNGEATMSVGPADRNGDPDPYIGDYDYSGFETGLKYSDMSAEAQASLTTLMQVYVYNMETTFADIWWESIAANIDDTYFVWIGEGDASASEYPVYYYRIYNPSLWVEYNIEGTVGPGVEAGNHAHSITRVPSTLNGGDYSIFANAINGNGPSTLLEHYLLADHHAFGQAQFDYELTN